MAVNPPTLLTNPPNPSIITPMSTPTKAEQIAEKLDALKAAYTETARTEFKTAFDELFVKYPALKKVSWTQYTPYFNDGEECSFGVHVDEPDINGFESYDSDGSKTNLWRRSGKDQLDYDPQAAACTEEVTELLNAFDADVYLDLFKDHSKVTITASGIKRTNYEHD